MSHVMRKHVLAICEQQRAQISLRIQFVSYLVGNPKDRFSLGEAHIVMILSFGTDRHE